MPRRSRRPRLVSLSSDVGSAYAAQMKAVLFGTLAPDRVVELAHDLPAHGVREAAFVVRAMAERFPAGTVHLVVVDPGVGGRRAPIIVACREGSRLVGPDNGVLAPLARALGGGTAYRIDPARVIAARARVGTTFDGRDLFAPVAAALANDESPRRLGPRVRPTELELPTARRGRGSALGQIVHVDHFGNLISNIPTAWLPRGARRVGVQLRRGRVRRLPRVTSYEALGRGRAGILGSSFGTIELSVAEGRAAERFGARVEDAVRVEWARHH